MPRELQQQLTVEFIKARRLSLPVIWLKQGGTEADPEDSLKDSIHTDLESWTDQNLGVRLTDGHFELRISAPDGVWAGCLFEAFDHLRVDARAAYGVNCVTSIIIRIDDPETISKWENRWPAGHDDKAGRRVKTEVVYSVPPTQKTKAIWRTSSPLPGSVIADGIVSWRPKGKKPADLVELGVEDLEARELVATEMESVCRAIAFATLLYWVRIYLDGLTDWDASLTGVIGGWLAKIIPEGQAINAQGRSLEGVCWAPISDADSAKTLLTFLQKRAHASGQLGVTFAHAETQLQRHPNARVPGWSNIETTLGVQAKIGLKRAFRAGIDINLIETLAEKYVYDKTDHKYLDRRSLLQGIKFDHDQSELLHQWSNQPFYVGKKKYNPFALFTGSQLRVDVKSQTFYPGHEPAAVLRVSPVHGVLNGEDKHPDEYQALNIFPGFKIKPIATVDPAIMKRAVSMLDAMLALLTQDNDAQMKWLKQFIAFIVQQPSIKAQVCPVVIGGQGIGKSFFGDNLMRALFNEMAGSADANSFKDNKFLITPFIGKLITFVDEVKLEPVAVNIIKKLIRQDVVSGQVKFGHQRDYYIPSKLMIASNQVDIGLSPADAADRAFFFIKAWDSVSKKMSVSDFLEWTLTVKPFYTKFTEALAEVDFKQHLMHYLTHFEVTRVELEDLRYSSRDDEEIVQSMMSEAREAARSMIADARILQNHDITAWFNKSAVRDAIRRSEGLHTKISAAAVIAEFERAGVLEPMHNGMYRFKYGYKKLCDAVGKAHNMALIPQWPIKPGADNEDNGVMSVNGAPSWRGLDPKNRRDSADPRRPYDPDEHLDM